MEINEDSCSVSPRYLLAMDGASGLFSVHVTEEASDARWLAQRGTEEFGALLETRDAPMAELCREAAETLRAEYLPRAGQVSEEAYPTAGVCALRLRDGLLEYYGLGDLTALVRLRDGRVETVHDDAITRLDGAALREMVRLAGERGEPVALQRPKIQALLREHRDWHNREGGYWIFDPSARGADMGTGRSWPAAEVASVALLSDGLADAVPVYGLAPDFPALLDWLEAEGPEAVCRALRVLQQADPGFDRFPRFKPGDDATAVLAELEETGSKG